LVTPRYIGVFGRKKEGAKWQKDDWQKDGPERGTVFRPK
jgi:hypothetical protein